MKHDGYFNRALQANDPRYARVFGKLGYSRADLTSDGSQEPPVQSGVSTAPPADGDAELHALREQYQEVVGKRPFHGWDAATLTSKIAAAQTN